jgi:hypothetical protein
VERIDLERLGRLGACGASAARLRLLCGDDARWSWSAPVRGRIGFLALRRRGEENRWHPELTTDVIQDPDGNDAVVLAEEATVSA